ncbi:MetQ/NlpA family ABC transporter substrate-binding protein [Psychrobacillus sp. OK032]|uniref:MetQ/NlpA family ABC transporter substrate-binding protein n=1 Tax=Psychrobacillus sp. OK032 TaxID=1884358 RepID=UPI0008BC1E18|nr:MetQ/NlpA family ABC transporter substrate-binding protein [Psychrobacillus sp. OK032]SES25811.1 D-methionine transport system substrate-binding protein [Psychrobacillus sp. OK032]
MKRTLYEIIIAIGLVILLVGCAGNEEASGSEADKVIKIGVTAGPHEEITNEVKKLAEKEGIKLEVVTFNDFILPNRALEKGEIDLNSYQNLPFLETFNEDHNADLVSIGKSVAMLMGLYSTKYDSVEDLPQGATVGLPNDPVNRSRALYVYQNAGLIKLKPGTDDKNATVLDIAENPKELKFKELESAMLARAMTSLDASTLNSNFALQEGYKPKEDAMYLNNEEKFMGVVVTTKENKDNEAYKRIVELYHAEEVKKFVEERYDGVIRHAEDPFN